MLFVILSSRFSNRAFALFAILSESSFLPKYISFKFSPCIISNTFSYKGVKLTDIAKVTKSKTSEKSVSGSVNETTYDLVRAFLADDLSTNIVQVKFFIL